MLLPGCAQSYNADIGAVGLEETSSDETDGLTGDESGHTEAIPQFLWSELVQLDGISTRSAGHIALDSGEPVLLLDVDQETHVSPNIAMIQFSSSGSVINEKLFGINGMESQIPSAIETDGTGIWIAGNGSDGLEFRRWVASFSPKLETKWSWISENPSYQGESAKGLAAGNDQEVALLGQHRVFDRVSGRFYSNVSLAVLDALGAELWDEEFPSGYQTSDVGFGIENTPAKGWMVFATHEPRRVEPEPAIGWFSEIAPHGELQQKTWIYAETNNQSIHESAFVNVDGNVALLLSSFSREPFGRLWENRVYSKDGELRSKFLSAEPTVLNMRMIEDSEGNLFSIGIEITESDGRRLYLRKHSFSGERLWTLPVQFPSEGLGSYSASDFHITINGGSLLASVSISNASRESFAWICSVSL